MSRTFGVMALSARVLSATHGSLFSWSWVKYSCFAEAAENCQTQKRLIFTVFTASVTGLKLSAWPLWIGWYMIVKARYSGWSEILDASGGYTLTIKVLGHIDFCLVWNNVWWFSLVYTSFLWTFVTEFLFPVMMTMTKSFKKRSRHFFALKPVVIRWVVFETSSKCVIHWTAAVSQLALVYAFRVKLLVSAPRKLSNSF